MVVSQSGDIKVGTCAGDDGPWACEFAVGCWVSGQPSPQMVHYPAPVGAQEHLQVRHLSQKHPLILLVAVGFVCAMGTVWDTSFPSHPAAVWLLSSCTATSTFFCFTLHRSEPGTLSDELPIYPLRNVLILAFMLLASFS